MIVTPQLDLMPRVSDDMKQCVEFIARQPWGKPEERRRRQRASDTKLRRTGWGAGGFGAAGPGLASAAAGAIFDASK